MKIEIKFDKDFRNEILKPLHEVKTKGFGFDTNFNYLGGKDENKEKVFEYELYFLMKKHKVIDVKANLIKDF